uniref:Uncharacterized protein n=1 Tax=Sphaerodactylus townsendi TaxID=933632 RepID=A0ACB8F6P8_9SAUR
MLRLGCFIICVTSLSNLCVFGKSVTALGSDGAKHGFAQDNVVLPEKPPTRRQCKEKNSPPVNGKDKVSTAEGFPNANGQFVNKDGLSPEGKRTEDFSSSIVRPSTDQEGSSLEGNGKIVNGKDKVSTAEGFPNANGQFVNKDGLSPEGKRTEEFSSPIVRPSTDQEGSSLEGNGKILSPEGVPNSESQKWSEG